jgi:hypothetical protein
MTEQTITTTTDAATGDRLVLERIKAMLPLLADEAIAGGLAHMIGAGEDKLNALPLIIHEDGSVECPGCQTTAPTVQDFEFQYYEPAYCRFTDAAVSEDGASLELTTDGWDDIAEDSRGPSHLSCAGCFTALDITALGAPADPENWQWT